MPVPFDNLFRGLREVLSVQARSDFPYAAGFYGFGDGRRHGLAGDKDLRQAAKVDWQFSVI